MTVCFFTHTDWFYAVNPFCSSLNCCLRLQITVHRLAVLLTVFWRKRHAKSVSAEKWKSYECRSYLFCVSMKLQFHKTWITLTSNSKMLQIFFSCAWNAIYTFTNLLLRLQILFALAVLCTLSQILPYACKSLWRKITFIVLVAAGLNIARALWGCSDGCQGIARLMLGCISQYKTIWVMSLCFLAPVLSQRQCRLSTKMLYNNNMHFS